MLSFLNVITKLMKNTLRNFRCKGKRHYPFDSFISNSVVYLIVLQQFGLCAQVNLSGDEFLVSWPKFEFLELQRWGKGLNHSDSSKAVTLVNASDPHTI